LFAENVKQAEGMRTSHIFLLQFAFSDGLYALRVCLSTIKLNNGSAIKNNVHLPEEGWMLKWDESGDVLKRITKLVMV
jgi:hypothetical protein